MSKQKQLMEAKRLFITEPHAAQSLWVLEAGELLHNQLFQIASNEGYVIMTGEELISLCRQFSKYAGEQDAMFEEDDE